MAIQTTTQRENLAVAYGATATYGAIYTTAPAGGNPGTEPTGGTPTTARRPLTWTAGAVDGTITATATFDVPAGTTIAGAGVHSAASGAGNFLDGMSFTAQAFSTQGALTVTFTYTQS